jgi:hypothetical protein
MRGRDVGVVLEATGDRLLLAPVTRRGFPHLAGDVELDDAADAVVARCGAGGLVRLSAAVNVSRRGQRHIGELSESSVWWIGQVSARLFAEAALRSQWQAERTRYRQQLAGERCVKL